MVEQTAVELVAVRAVAKAENWAALWAALSADLKAETKDDALADLWVVARAEMRAG